MGCWNGTCAISQLAILAGEPCRIVFLRGLPTVSRDGNAGAGFCYPTGLWKPVSLPIPAEYDDYGAVENFDADDWRVRSFLEWVEQHVVETKEGPNSVHDTPITKERIQKGGLGELCEIIHSQPHRIRVVDAIAKSMWAYTANVMKESNEDPGPFQPDPLSYCLIREDVYQGLIKQSLNNWAGTSTIESYYEPKIDEWLKELSELLAETEDYTQRPLFRLSGSSLWYGGEGAGDILERLRETLLDGLATVVDEGGDVPAHLSTVKAKTEQVARYRWVEVQMGHLRKFWSPQSGAGSQDDGIEAQTAFLKITQQALENMKARFED